MSVLTVYYVTATGRGRLVYMHEDTSVTADYDALKDTGESYATFPSGDDVDLDKYYFPSGVRTPRPDFDVNIEDTYWVDVGDTVTLSNMPIGTVVSDEYNNVEYAATLTLQNLTVTPAIMGSFVFTIEPPFPYKTRVIEVNTGDRH